MTAAELFDQARQGLEMHRLRATLSLLGIVVGIGTVVASLAVGEGARRAAMQDIAALGIDNVFARAVAGADNPRARAAAPGSVPSVWSTVGLHPHDAKVGAGPVIELTLESTAERSRSR